MRTHQRRVVEVPEVRRMSKLDGFQLHLPPPSRETVARPDKPVAKEGTAITCPQCKARIGVLARTLYHAFTVAADSIVWEPGQKHDHGEGAICKTCGATYMAVQQSLEYGRRILLHTEIGWI